MKGLNVAYGKVFTNYTLQKFQISDGLLKKYNSKGKKISQISYFPKSKTKNFQQTFYFIFYFYE